MPMIVGPCGAFMTTIEKPMDKAEIERREKERAERVERLINRVSKSSPIGKKLIESAIERGISIGIDGNKGNSLGTYMHSMKYVSLSETASDAQLLSTIVHECRHSEQTPKRDLTYTMYASICETRAMEADAMAHECAAVYQMRKAEPETYMLFCNRHGGIMNAYETSFEKEKDETKAKAEAFKAWYDHAEYVELYDRSVTDFMVMGKTYGKAYKQDLSTELLSENVPYVEPSFFTSARATTVSEKTARESAKIEQGHVRNMLKLFGKSKLPTSADKFYVREENGQVRPPVANAKPQERIVAASIMQKATRSAGR